MNDFKGIESRLRDWLLNGHIGYSEYTDDDLIKDALDADLTIAHDIAYDAKLDQYNREKK